MEHLSDTFRPDGVTLLDLAFWEPVHLRAYYPEIGPRTSHRLLSAARAAAQNPSPPRDDASVAATLPEDKPQTSAAPPEPDEGQQDEEEYDASEEGQQDEEDNDASEEDAHSKDEEPAEAPDDDARPTDEDARP